MTRAELLDMFTPIYNSFVQIAAAGVSIVHPKIADVVIDPTKDFKYNAISGLGMWEAAGEDTSEGLDHFVIGYEGTITPTKYRKYFYVSFEANDQMEYAALKAKITDASALGRGGPARLEALVASILIGGFSTACADGLYLYYNTHYKNPEETGTTYDNLLADPFSHDALEAAEKQIAKNFFDLDGLPMAAYAGQPVLAFPPALRGPVGRVLSERANEQPGTTLRNINLYSGKYNPAEWDYLGTAMGGTDTQWHIIYPALKTLKLVKNTEKLHYASWIENLLQRYYFDGWLHAEAGATDWRGLFGSTGT